LILFASRSADWLASLAAGAERLVPLSVVGEPARACHRRLGIAAMLLPFLPAAAFVQTLADQIGGMAILALVSAVIGSCWLTAIALVLSGNRLAEIVLLLLLTVATAGVLAGAGGLSSPLALLAIMPLVESLWVRRDRIALIAGAAASAAALLLQGKIAEMAGLDAVAASAWHWLVPAAYVASLVVRLQGLVAEREEDAAARRPIGAEDVIDAVILKLSRSGDVLDASAKCKTILGLQPGLLLGSGLFDRVHVGDRISYLCALSDLREGAAQRTVEVRLRSPRGSEDDQDATYASFRLELANTGDADQPVVVFLRANEEAAALRAALAEAREAADKVDIAKSRFLAIVSHELRTPLNAIIGFSDMLDHEMFGAFADPRQKEYVGLIRDSGNHLLAVVTSILDVSKIDCGSYPIEPEPFRFADAVDTCRSMMQLQADAKSLTLVADIPPSAGQIAADRRAVQQMLINLISNAVKFTPTGGTVSIGANRLGSRLHFWVSDTGIGISEDDLGRIGKPFTQVRNDYSREHQGAGLGLSLVKGLVRLHEGAMMVESAPGEGTLVTISLPVAGPTGKIAAGDAGAIIRLKNDEVSDGQIKKIA
jgi:cell cycle sensor histidine kinase DivJ